MISTSELVTVARVGFCIEDEFHDQAVVCTDPGHRILSGGEAAGMALTSVLAVRRKIEREPLSKS